MVQYDGNGTPKKAPLSLQIDLARFEPATEEEKRQQDVMSKQLVEKPLTNRRSRPF